MSSSAHPAATSDLIVPSITGSSLKAGIRAAMRWAMATGVSPASCDDSAVRRMGETGNGWPVAVPFPAPTPPTNPLAPANREEPAPDAVAALHRRTAVLAKLTAGAEPHFAQADMIPL